MFNKESNISEVTAMKKKVLSMLLAVALIVGMIPAVALTAFADGCKLTCEKGIQVETSWSPFEDDASLTIYAQSDDSNPNKGTSVINIYT